MNGAPHHTNYGESLVVSVVIFASSWSDVSRALERLPLGMSYVEQVEHVRKLTTQVWSELVVDQTGVGRGVVDMFRDKALVLHAVSITAGDAEPSYELVKGGQNWKVSKRLLVSTLVALLHSERLKISTGLPLAQTLVDEL